MATVRAGERWEDDEGERRGRERRTGPDELPGLEEPALPEDPAEVAAFKKRVAQMAEEARRMKESETPIQAAFRRAREAGEKLERMRGDVGSLT